MQKQINNVRLVGSQHAPIVGHGGESCILDHREDFVKWANNNDGDSVDVQLEAVFCGHTHEDHAYWKVTKTNFENPPDIYETESATSTLEIYFEDDHHNYYSTAYIESGNST